MLVNELNRIRPKKMILSFGLCFSIALICACESAKNNTISSGGDEAREELSAGEPVVNILSSCGYQNLFSSTPECRNYTGTAWTLESAQSDCAAQLESAFSQSSCDQSLSLGTCSISSNDNLDYDIILAGDEPTGCQTAAQGCVIFARGVFSPSALCIGQYEPVEPVLPDEIGDVFVPFELMCLEGESRESGGSCTWQAIGGCAPEGELFADYASCNPVFTQRPYAPVPPSGFETPVDDPIRSDESFLNEVEWVRSQAKSCGCVCCHEESKTPSGAAVWDTDREGIWTDDWNPSGLAMGAGWVDSSSLGAFPSTENNGFDRDSTVLPTTDVERMIRFFEGELARRGYSREDFRDATPIGGPIYDQRIFEPNECAHGEGISTDGTLSWVGGAARYFYLLEVGSANPGPPPNLDLPEGTIWRLDVSHEASGINQATYGVSSENTRQGFPQEGSPAALVPGQQYYLYVVRDIGVPLTRCLFTYDEGTTMPIQPTEAPMSPWADTCAESSDCQAPTDFCVKAPGDEEGYCSVHCNSAAACADAGAPATWACVAVSCAAEAFTWCGDPAEVEESGGFLSLCP